MTPSEQSGRRHLEGTWPANHKFTPRVWLKLRKVGTEVKYVLQICWIGIVHFLKKNGGIGGVLYTLYEDSWLFKIDKNL